MCSFKGGKEKFLTDNDLVITLRALKMIYFNKEKFYCDVQQRLGERR